MTLESVDDQYEGCTKEMSGLVTKTLLKKELEYKIFNDAWNESEKKIPASRDNLTQNHLIALHVYTCNEVYSEFNKDVRESKSKYKNKTFKWHSLHFLLTEAIQILNRNQNNCHSIYRGTNSEFQGENGTEFRFGSFTSFSRNQSKTKTFGNISCFEIEKYKGAELTNYSRYPDEQEMLIPPYEIFKVIDVKNKTDQQDLWCDTVFKLESIGIISNLNCALFESSTQKILKSLKKLFCGCCGSQ